MTPIENALLGRACVKAGMLRSCTAHNGDQRGNMVMRDSQRLMDKGFKKQKYAKNLAEMRMIHRNQNNGWFALYFPFDFIKRYGVLPRKRKANSLRDQIGFLLKIDWYKMYM